MQLLEGWQCGLKPAYERVGNAQQQQIYGLPSNDLTPPISPCLPVLREGSVGGGGSLF